MDVNKIIMESLQEILEKKEEKTEVSETVTIPETTVSEEVTTEGIKEETEEVAKTLVKHPAISGGTAAAIAAGLGALALRKKLASTKTVKDAKKKMGKVAAKVAKKLNEE